MYTGPSIHVHSLPSSDRLCRAQAHPLFVYIRVFECLGLDRGERWGVGQRPNAMKRGPDALALFGYTDDISGRGGSQNSQMVRKTLAL